jgi:hypothetical protein
LQALQERAQVGKALEAPVGPREIKIWVWVNTYKNTILSGMNIHFNPAMTWGEQKVSGF